MQTNGMKRSNSHAGDRPLSAKSFFQPLPHFCGGLIGKSHRRDLVGLYTTLFNQIGNAGDQRISLAGSRPRYDRHNRFFCRNSRLLL